MQPTLLQQIEDLVVVVVQIQIQDFDLERTVVLEL
jgi:hypothetical protein